MVLLSLRCRLMQWARHTYETLEAKRSARHLEQLNAEYKPRLTALRAVVGTKVLHDTDKA